MNWPATLAPLLAPNFLVTVLVTNRRRSCANDRRPFCHALRRLVAGVELFVE